MLFGWCVISHVPVGMASISGLIGFVVNVVKRGCQLGEVPPGINPRSVVKSLSIIASPPGVVLISNTYVEV